MLLDSQFSLLDLVVRCKLEHMLQNSEFMEGLGAANLRSEHLVKFAFASSASPSEVINKISSFLTSGCLDMHSEATVAELNVGLESWPGVIFEVVAELLARIGAELDTYRSFGNFLRLFVESPKVPYEHDEIAQILRLVVSHRDVRDLSGEKRDLLVQLPQYSGDFESELMGDQSSDEDMDEFGNLKEFVTYSGEEELSESDDSDDSGSDASDRVIVNPRKSQKGKNRKLKKSSERSKKKSLRRQIDSSTSSSSDSSDSSDSEIEDVTTTARTLGAQKRARGTLALSKTNGKHANSVESDSESSLVTEDDSSDNSSDDSSVTSSLGSSEVDESDNDLTIDMNITPAKHNTSIVDINDSSTDYDSDTSSERISPPSNLPTASPSGQKKRERNERGSSAFPPEHRKRRVGDTKDKSPMSANKGKERSKTQCKMIQSPTPAKKVRSPPGSAQPKKELVFSQDFANALAEFSAMGD